jgi:lipopolysaccharide export system protein LptA
MKPRFWIACILVPLSAAVVAQEKDDKAFSQYTTMSMVAGYSTGNFIPQIEKLTGNAKIVLQSENPEVPDLPIRAQEMYFEYEGKSATPSLIEMMGKVDIRHPDVHVTADKAVWDMKTGILVFTGQPVMTTPDGKEFRGTKLTVDMEKNSWSIEKPEAPELPVAKPTAAQPVISPTDPKS